MSVIKDKRSFLFLGKHPRGSTWDISSQYITLFRSLTMLGSNKNYEKFYQRIGYMTIITSSMVLYWIWEAGLISYFSFPFIPLPFTTLEGFLTNTDQKVQLFLYFILY